MEWRYLAVYVSVMYIIAPHVCSRLSDTVYFPGSSCGSVFEEISGADIVSASHPGYSSCVATFDAGDDVYSAGKQFMIRFEVLQITNCDISLNLFDSDNPNGMALKRLSCDTEFPHIIFTSGRYLTIRLDDKMETTEYSFRMTITSYTPYSCEDFRCSNGYCIDDDLLCDKINHCFDGSDETPYFPADCSSWTHISTTAYYVFRFGVGAIVGLVAAVMISCVVVTAVFLLWYRRKVTQYRQLMQLTQPAFPMQNISVPHNSPHVEHAQSMYPSPGNASGPPTYNVADYGSTDNIPLVAEDEEDDDEMAYPTCKV